MHSQNHFLFFCRQLAHVLMLCLAIQAPTLWAFPFNSEHVNADIVVEKSDFHTNQENWIAIRLNIAPHWHIYWKNPGDSGLETRFKFELPEGLVLNKLLWPTPERIELEGLVSYGYHDQAIFLASFSGEFSALEKVKVQLNWLECNQSCLPGQQKLEWQWGSAHSHLQDHADFFRKAREQIPKFKIDSGEIVDNGDTLLWKPAISQDISQVSKVIFFPLEDGLVKYGGVQRWDSEKRELHIPLVTQEKKSDSLRGVIRLWTQQDQPLDSIENKWTIQRQGETSNGTDMSSPQNFFLMLFFAFLGGLLLNVMPCVLPVLSIKIMHVLEQQGGSPKATLLSALAYTAGVIFSFWALALTLILFRQAGAGLGWGFQLQSIGVVCVLISLFLLLALNLFGVFEVGLSLVGLDQKVPSVGGQLGTALGSGALATLAATPCTAPYMGAALGYALTLSTVESLAIFTFLGLGMAFPFLLVGVYPKSMAFLPKPGAWMLTFKQGMGFLMMGTVAYLYYVAATLLEDQERLLNIGFGLVIIAFGAWCYGKWAYGTGRKVWLARLGALLCLIIAAWLMMPREKNILWQPYNEAELRRLVDSGQPVFLDFTASWCLSCKANERRVLDSSDTIKLFRQKGIVAMKADWTRRDPKITKALERLGRNSVPVYAAFRDKNYSNPQLLPEVLNYSDLESAFSSAKDP